MKKYYTYDYDNILPRRVIKVTKKNDKYYASSNSLGIRLSIDNLDDLYDITLKYNNEYNIVFKFEIT